MSPSSNGAPVVVLGAGLAGLACAERLEAAGVRAAVFEQCDEIGGNARSTRADGFVFDRGPHVSFTNRPEIRELLGRAVDSAELRARILNHWRGRLVPHPAQFHLHGLPPELVAECIEDLVAAHAAPELPPESYAAWCEQSLGRAFSAHFTFPYTRKYWTVEASQMSTDWIAGRMRRPSVHEMILGALAARPPDHHYFTEFRYPVAGGFDRYLAAVRSSASLFVGQRAVAIDPAQRTVRFASGRVEAYERLVSSIPLPELVGIISGAPRAIRAAAADLTCTSAVLVNVGVRRNEGFPDAHWLYVYDESVPFARVTFPHAIAPANAPAGCGSIQVEIYHSRYRPLPAKDLEELAIAGLRRCGLLLDSDELLHTSVQRIPFANVLFDMPRHAAVRAVRGWVESTGVDLCGRYGEWGYLWSDDSIVSGRNAAARALASLGRTPGSTPHTDLAR